VLLCWLAAFRFFSFFCAPLYDFHDKMKIKIKTEASGAVSWCQKIKWSVSGAAEWALAERKRSEEREFRK